MITFTTDDISAIVGYVGELVGDFLPLIVVVLGISIGLWVIDAIIHKR